MSIGMAPISHKQTGFLLSNKGNIFNFKAAIEASKILRERMQPMRNKFPNATWKELCDKCLHNKIDLSARYM